MVTVTKFCPIVYINQVCYRTYYFSDYSSLSIYDLIPYGFDKYLLVENKRTGFPSVNICAFINPLLLIDHLICQVRF